MPANVPLPVSALVFAEAPMKNSRFILILVALSLALLFLGCSGKPTEQIERAEKTRAAALAASAAEFAAQDWKDAEDDWAVAQRALENEKWGDAATALMKASAHYNKAAQIAQGLKDQTLKEISGTQETAKLRIETLRKDLEANAKKVPAAKMKSIQEGIKAVQEKLASATSQVEKGQFQDAKLQAGTALREIWEAQKDLDQALGKKGK
jgi:hypothetical protein